MTDAPHHLTIADASSLIARQELSPVALTEAFLERIEAVDPKLNAYVTVTGERALDDARTADKRSLPAVTGGRYTVYRSP